MDMNELFRRHQLALIAVQQGLASGAPCSAAHDADEYAKVIKASKQDGTPHHAVLSSHTFIALASM